MRTRQISSLILPASVLLFTLQGARVLFSMLFGILYDQLFAGSPGPWMVISILLVLAAFGSPVISPGLTGSGWRRVLVILAGLSRLALSINQADVRFWGALVVVATGGLYLAALIRSDFRAVLPALLTALALEGFLRAFGESYDVSLRLNWILVQVVWSTGLIWVAVRQKNTITDSNQPTSGLSRSAGLAVGIILFLELSLLGLPGGIAGWSVPRGEAADWSGNLHAWLTPLLLALTWLPLIPRIRDRILRPLCDRRGAGAGVGILLSATLMAGYFLSGVPSLVALLMAHGLALLALVCILSVPKTMDGWPGSRLALGWLLFLLLNFLNAFTFTYPYTLPALQNKGWAVYLGGGLILTLSLALRRTPSQQPREEGLGSASLGLIGMILVILVGVRAWPRTPLPLESESLTAATWNIHYGYDKDWRFNLDQMAEEIESNGVDVIALQEVDAGRLTSFSVDNAYFLARRLRMNAVYLPNIEGLTGIALLYRGEKAPHGAAWLPSLQEQTGIIHAPIVSPGGGSLHAFAIWMGLSDEDTRRQIQAGLDFIGSRSPAIFGGDFNAHPGEPVYTAVGQANFDDPFLILGIEPPPPTSPAVNLENRIDFVWVRELVPVVAHVADSLVSDHRMVVVDLEWP